MTASTQHAASNDTMLLEAKLSVCEKLVRETGEYHGLELLGFKSLLPPRKGASPKEEDIIGVWRSGLNPAIHEAPKQPIPVYEERIHYLEDGRVCGIQQAFDPTPADSSSPLSSSTFAGTWKLSGSSLVEDYSKGRPPAQLRQGQTRRVRKVVSLSQLGGARSGEVSRGLRFEGAWPNYFETVPRSKVVAFRSANEDTRMLNNDLPSYCFDIGPIAKERAAK